MSRLEQEFLGSIIYYGSTGLELIDEHRVTLSEFQENTTRKVFSAIQEIQKRGEPLSVQTVAALLPHDLMTALYEWYGAAGSPGLYLEQLRKENKRKALQNLLGDLRQVTENPEADPEQAIDKALLGLSQIQDKGVTNTAISLREAAADLISKLDQPPRFIPTPWPALNELIGGFRPGALYVIGARPSIGKSLVALQLATRLAESAGPVQFFSLEMQVEEIAARALAASSGIGLGTIDSREITAEQRATLEAQLLTPDLYVDATSELSVSQLRPKIRQLKAKTGALPAAVFVDYLQLLESPEGFRASSLYETTTAISKQLKRLAMELDLPVVALAQLNRESEKRPGAPALYDLKDSGSIEQDADVVILLSEDKQRRLSLSVSKNRQGPRGSLTGEVNRATMTVRNLVRD